MTTKRPWYPHYILDYRADTSHLTLEEHGIYRTLIDEYWLKGGLPTGEVQLARIVGLSVEEWRYKCINVVCLFEPNFRHKRIEKELKKCDNITTQRRNAINKRWANKRKLENTNVSPPYGAPNDAPNDTLHTSNGRDSYLLDPTKLNLLPEQEIRAKPKQIKTRQAYPPDFEVFWRAYPTDPNMSKKEALKAWQKLSEEDKKAATESVPSFKAYCAKTKDYRAVYADRYLKQGRFEGHSQIVAKPVGNSGIFVKRDTPQWEAWQEWWMKTKGKSMPGGDGWFCPSEWPPQ